MRRDRKIGINPIVASFLIRHRIALMVSFMYLSEGIAGLSFVMFILNRDIVALGISLFSLIVSVGLHILISVHTLYDKLSVMSLPVLRPAGSMKRLTTADCSSQSRKSYHFVEGRGEEE